MLDHCLRQCVRWVCSRSKRCTWVQCRLNAGSMSKVVIQNLYNVGSLCGVSWYSVFMNRNPANTRRWADVALTSGRRRRRWARIRITLIECFLFDRNTAKTKHLYNICTMLGQRRRHCADVVQILCKCFCVCWEAIRVKSLVLWWQPSKYEILTQCCFDVGSTSNMVGQNQNNTASMFRVCTSTA